MVLGWALRKKEVITQEFVDVGNSFVFKVTLPAMLFDNMISLDMERDMDPHFVVFSSCCVLASVALVWMGTRLFLRRRPDLRGEFIQAAYRGSYIVLGTVFLKNMYGGDQAGVIEQTIFGGAPFTNVLAVVVLVLEWPREKGQARHLGQQLRASLKSIVTNPMIVAIALGWACAILRVPIPTILQKACANVGSLTGPLALITMGGAFDFSGAFRELRYTVAASIIKLVLLPGIFIPLAIWVGFRDQQLIGILLLSGASTASTSYVVAKVQGYEGELSSRVVVATTLLSSVTLTAWIFLLRTLGYVA